MKRLVSYQISATMADNGFAGTAGMAYRIS